MKKIIVVAALLAGCLSCFGDNWKTTEDENILMTALANKNKHVFTVSILKENCHYVLALANVNLSKIRKDDFIDVCVDGVKLRFNGTIFLDDGTPTWTMSGNQLLTILKAKRRITVKYSGRTFEFIP